MADYNIYIRSIVGGGDQQFPTTPWSEGNPQTTPWQASSGSASGESSGNSEGNSPLEIIAKFGKGVDKFKGIVKGAAAILVAKKVVETAWKVAKIVVNYGAIESGNYQAQTWMDNAEQTFQNLTHPISTFMGVIRANQMFRITNEKNRLNRDLLGDSVINQYSNRGV